jgi:hypothetical protein
LVAGEIIDHREIESVMAEKRDEMKGVGKKMIRRDKIDIVHLAFLNHLRHLRKQPIHIHDPATTIP